MKRRLSDFYLWLSSPWGVLTYAALWLLLTHWGGTLWVVSWGSLFVTLGVGKLGRSLYVLGLSFGAFARARVPAPGALVRPVQRHTTAARAYLDKLRDDDDSEVAREL